MNFPLGQVNIYPGYQAIVFLHDNGIFSTLIARSSDDHALAALRFPDLFDAAARAIPGLAAWTDPTRSHPYTSVLPGGRLHNTYQGQLDDTGAVALPGLVFVGDTVCTTNPALGRGVTTSLLQARELLRLLEHDDHDLAGADRWPSTLGAPTTSPPGSTTTSTGTPNWPVAGPAPTSTSPDRCRPTSSSPPPRPTPHCSPSSPLTSACAPCRPALTPSESRAREIYIRGWRPPIPAGPTHDELVHLIFTHTHAPLRSRPNTPISA